MQRDAISIRRKLLEMHFHAQAGHLGTGLSSIEILTYLYRQWLGAPSSGDRFILSKGHGASALYATLNRVGLLSDADLSTYYKDGTWLPAHPAPAAYAAITAATGALGHGLPIGTGMAYALKYLQTSRGRIAVLVSDGECNEGSLWEAALFAGHHKLNNLTVIVDQNGLQGFGRTEEVLDMRPFAAKWEAFGFETREIGGHDFEELHGALGKPAGNRPLCVIARTIKGKGVSFMENRLEWHYLALKEPQFRQAIAELEAKP